MRVFLSCLVCRFVHFILHKMGRGATTMPGRVALKVKRNVLSDLSKNVKVIIVTGTNGKTTSCRIIEEGLKKAGKVSLVGFGTFSAKKREARDGINPLTKEPLHIPAKTVASFKAGSKLKDALN